MMLLLLCALLVGGVVSSPFVMEQKGVADMNLYDLAKSQHLWALLTLTDAANITSVLEDPGPYTIFAPTDKAIQDQMNPMFQEQLTKNLTLLQEALKYHAVEGKIMSSSLKNNEAVTTIEGSPLRVSTYTASDGSTGVSVNGAMVTKADLSASNGVIHIVNQFIYPIPMYDMGTFMDKNPKMYSTLYGLLQKANLLDTLKGGTYSLFAPMNSAFEQVPKDTLDKIKGDADLLKKVLTYHLLEGARYSTTFPHMLPGWVKTVEGDSLSVWARAFGPVPMPVQVVMVNNCQAEMRDAVTNGVMYMSTCVLIPPGVI